jgi:DNA-binding SARP family transcriptional activator
MTFSPAACPMETGLMLFSLLGPLTVRDDTGDEITLTGARQRSLLACLLVHANTPVSTDTLIDAVWDDRRPAGSAMMVRSAVMRLRQTLGPRLAPSILTQPAGYLIRAGQENLDLLRFEVLCREANLALQARAWNAAARRAADAVTLWRGEPLADIPSPGVRERIVPRLEQLRLQVLEDGAEADLRLGRHDLVVPRLREMVAIDPLRERFHAQLMLALARSGQRAEAVAVYRQARRVLIDELGIEPGPELSHLHKGILASDARASGAAVVVADDTGPTAIATDEDDGPAEVAQAESSVAGGPAGPARVTGLVPRRLPAAPRHFTGRQDELESLSQLLARPEDARTVVISAIDGMAGIGKPNPGN